MSNLNNSGHKAYDKAVIVRMDTVDEKIGSIIIPEKEREKQQFAEVYGLLVSAGANAFGEATEEAKRRGIEPDVPRPGDRVTVTKYAGYLLHKSNTKDGNEYRVCNDEDIIALVEEGSV